MLCHCLTTGKEISEQDTEEKVVASVVQHCQGRSTYQGTYVHGYAEQASDLQVLMKQTVDKTAKSPSGEYVPTGETKEENEIDKLFQASTRRTTAEIRAGAETGVFIDSWKAKWEGKVKNKAKGGDGSGAKAGAPKPAAASTKPTSSLFG
jgi:hypothetical protein